MTRHTRTAIEVAIILAVAAAVELIPGGRQTADAIYAALIFAFGVAVFWIALRAYRERRMDLYTLGDGRRALFYGAIGVLIVTLAAQSRLWATGLGEFAFWVIVGLSIYVLFALVLYARRY
jgi:hypothetical protein